MLMGISQPNTMYIFQIDNVVPWTNETSRNRWRLTNLISYKFKFVGIYFQPKFYAIIFLANVCNRKITILVNSAPPTKLCQGLISRKMFYQKKFSLSAHRYRIDSAKILIRRYWQYMIHLLYIMVFQRGKWSLRKPL